MLFLSPKHYSARRVRPTAWLRFGLHHLGRRLVCQVESATLWHSRSSVVEIDIEDY